MSLNQQMNSLSTKNRYRIDCSGNERVLHVIKTPKKCSAEVLACTSCWQWDGSGTESAVAASAKPVFMRERLYSKTISEIHHAALSQDGSDRRAHMKWQQVPTRRDHGLFLHVENPY
jgi:hypothetical protein